MGRFQDWFKRQRAVVRNPDDVKTYWDVFVGIHWEEFAAYERYIDREGRTPADSDPNLLLNQAKNPPPAAVVPAAPAIPVPAAAGPLPPAAPLPAAGPAAAPPPNLQARTLALGQSLDTLSDRVFAVCEVERQRERVEIFVQREQIAQARIPAAAAQPQGMCTVRLQVQTNFKMKGGKDTLATEVIENPQGVSADSVDEAFERLVLGAAFGNKLEAQMREAYSIHRNSWGTYAVGVSNSVYFDESSITTAGRPRGGYRLDVENVRVAPGKRNFI